MATEGSRTTSVRRITNPDDSATYVDLKVIDKISFIDPRDHYQESEYTFDNTSRNTSREVHAVTVTGKDDPSSKVQVERIDSFDVSDDKDHGQETITSLLNSDDPPRHLETHTLKVFNADDPSIWIKVQRVDRVSVLDPQSSGQETDFELTWADGSSASDDGTGNTNIDNTENSAYDSNLEAPDTSSDGTEINPPWRTDPFQNIVDVSWGGSFLVFYGGSNMAALPMSMLDDPAHFTTPPTIYHDTASNRGGIYVKLNPALADVRVGFYSALGGVLSGTNHFNSRIAVGADGDGGSVDSSILPPAQTSTGDSTSGGQSGALAGIYSWSDPTTCHLVTGTYAESHSRTTGGFPQTSTSSIAGTCNGSVPVSTLSFSQSGGYDVLAIRTSNATMTYSDSGGGSYTEFGGGGGTGTITETCSYRTDYLGLSSESSFIQTAGYISGIFSSTFTNIVGDHFAFLANIPWPAGNPYYSRIQTDSVGALTYSIVTPYETISGASPRVWLHVSNGKHVIQGIKYLGGSGHSTASQLLYLDGQRFEATLAAIVGCSVMDLTGVLMDAHASDYI